MYKVLIILLFPFILLANENDPRIDYIDRYKQLAVDEMLRTGIPASIKLAQGLLESGAGSSTLAREANNHFGIKCGGSWEGETYYRKDDDRNSKGELIASCFRKFGSVYESYFAHSDFLTKQRRYAGLFDLSQTDYNSWARGLKKAGYATDKRYADKLIDIIEDYQLYLFDTGMPQEVILAEQAVPTEKEFIEEDAPAPISIDAKPSKKKTARKKSSRRNTADLSEKESHLVQVGETIESIARKYDLNAAKLRIRNRLPKDAIVLEGERIHLRKKISVFTRPEFTREAVASNRRQEEEFIF